LWAEVDDVLPKRATAVKKKENKNLVKLQCSDKEVPRTKSRLQKEVQYVA